jgi:hypothetical protein
MGARPAGRKSAYLVCCCFTALLDLTFDYVLDVFERQEKLINPPSPFGIDAHMMELYIFFKIITGVDYDDLYPPETEEIANENDYCKSMRVISRREVQQVHQQEEHVGLFELAGWPHL